VRWALDEEPVVTVEGAGVIDVVPWAQADSCTLHLVNFTNPFMMKGPFRELIPIGEQRVSWRLPTDRVPRSVRLLVADRGLPFEVKGGRLECTVPSIRDHEVVAVDFA
jgi:hypothetical protein